MATWIAGFVAAATIAATYFCCVRPAMRGRCAMGGTPNRHVDADRQVAELREELRAMRAQDALDSGRVSGRRPVPPADA